MVDTVTQEGGVVKAILLLETYYDVLKDSLNVEERSQKLINARLKKLMSTRLPN